MADIHFRALRTFDVPELRSTYVQGMFYTARPEYELLQSFLPKWIEDGWVEEVKPDFQISGSGLIIDP